MSDLKASVKEYFFISVYTESHDDMQELYLDLNLFQNLVPIFMDHFEWTGSFTSQKEVIENMDLS